MLAIYICLNKMLLVLSLRPKAEKILAALAISVTYQTSAQSTE